MPVSDFYFDVRISSLIEHRCNAPFIGCAAIELQVANLSSQKWRYFLYDKFFST
jgi:hypothetical protein